MTARERAEALLGRLSVNYQIMATSTSLMAHESDIDLLASALSDDRRRVWEDAATAVLQTTIKLDVDWMRTATKVETIAETLRQASAALSAKAHAGQEG